MLHILLYLWGAPRGGSGSEVDSSARGQLGNPLNHSQAQASGERPAALIFTQYLGHIQNS